MEETGSTPSYSDGEELANSIIHGVGAVLASVALVVLIISASSSGNAWHVISCSIFGATLILLYTASTLYHSIKLPRARKLLRILDHCAIFLLIAGTYTPFLLVSLQGPWGWSLFGVIWGLAFLGIVLQVSSLQKWFWVSLALYLCMGWAAVIAIKPLLNSISFPGFMLVLLGGLSYTGGVIFYLWRRLPYHHAFWHACVLAGSACHFFAVLYYVIPPA